MKPRMLIQILSVIIITTIFSCNALKIHVSDYDVALTLTLNSGWSEEYWLPDVSDEQWYKIMTYTGLYSALYTEDLSKNLLTGE